MWIKIFKPKNKKEHNAVLNHLNEWGGAVYASAYNEFSNMAKNESENVFKIFDDWWHGKSVCTEEYKANYTAEEHKIASSIILTAISSGFG